FRSLRWRVPLPAAPASVVLVVILAETRLEFLVPALGPRVTVLERRHQPSKKGRKPLFSQAPPASTMQAPLTEAACSPQSHRALAADSSGRPKRLKRTRWRTASATRRSATSSSAPPASSIGPGAIALTRTPRTPHSTASVWVRLSTPALAAAECAVPGPPVQA